MGYGNSQNGTSWGLDKSCCLTVSWRTFFLFGLETSVGAHWLSFTFAYLGFLRAFLCGVIIIIILVGFVFLFLFLRQDDVLLCSPCHFLCSDIATTSQSHRRLKVFSATHITQALLFVVLWFVILLALFVWRICFYHLHSPGYDVRLVFAVPPLIPSYFRDGRVWEGLFERVDKGGNGEKEWSLEWNIPLGGILRRKGYGFYP